MDKTPLIKADNLKKYLKVNFDIYFKREDLSPYGSHKGRSIPVMMQKYIKQGKNKFCLSSSGNAALAAAIFTSEYNSKNDKNIVLKIFIGKKIPWTKAHLLKKVAKKDKNIEIIKGERPKQMAWQAQKNEGYQNLRQSTSDLALVGYTDLWTEISSQVKNPGAIIVPTSSGTTVAGLYEAIKKSNSQTKLHLVQTDFCHPFVKSPLCTASSLAMAIVDKVGHRKQMIAKLLSKGNYAWVVTDKSIKQAIKLVKKTEKIKISPNSALAIVGLVGAIKKGVKFTGPAVCLLTGK